MSTQIYRYSDNQMKWKGGIAVFILLFSILTVLGQSKIKLVILHTNDTHSQVEPTDKSSLKTSDMGGYARRMGVINQIRAKEENVLLVDAGDYSQGTPYFNFLNGRVEIDAMNRMKYDAGTLGNHEFDNGIDTLAVVLRNAKFPMISSNYKLDHTSLSGLVKPYVVLERSGLRIGILALDVNPVSLIFEKNYKGMEYQDPVEKANEVSALLKKREKCDVIICLSHLGGDSTSKKVNDFEIARKTRYIDVIIGGHSHSMITNTTVKNAAGKPMVIAQMGKSGLYLGRVELEIKKK
ncbi:MAG: metallophosphatase [Bacteroidota bacterium]|nr:metallophosphatase [Bacteroidota bacterium]